MTRMPVHPEAAKAMGKIYGWFADLENRKPDLVGRVVPMITSLAGIEKFSLEKLKMAEPFVDVGFRLMSDWLTENGHTPLNLGNRATDEISGALIRTIKSRQKTLSKEELYTRGGITADEGPKVDAEIEYFSKSVNYALSFGISPKNILGGLIYYSTLPNGEGDIKNEKTCAALREIMDKASGGKLAEIGKIAWRFANS